jgi:hypothetical protein
MTRDIIDTLRDRIAEDGDCLRWTGACSNGHPSMHIKGGSALVRRVLWEERHGPIPRGKIVRCTCNTPKCVNLAHCRLTTTQALARRLGAAGFLGGPVRAAKYAAKYRASERARITQEAVRAIRDSKDRSTHLAALYGVHVSTVERIKNGTARREYSSNVWAGLGA